MTRATEERDPAISVVVPVYRSAAWLAELVRELLAVLESLGRSHEIILVDDCSPDDSWATIADLCRRHPAVGGIRLMANGGQPKATLCGLARARGRIVATMDDDFQHDPAELPKLIAALDQNPGMDCVLGAFEEKRHATWRNWGSALLARVLVRSYGLPKGMRSSAFRAMRRPVAEAMLAQRLMSPSIPVLLFGSTRQVMNVWVEHSPRKAGRSSYTFGKLLRLALDNVCYSSMLPLRLISGMGVAVCGLSFGLLAVFLVKYLRGGVNEPGFMTLVVLITFLTGSIMLALGVIGEYMARILREVRVRPMYVVRETAGCLGEPAAEGSAP